MKQCVPRRPASVFALVGATVLLCACEALSPGPLPADEGFGSCATPDEGCACEEGHVIACYPEAPFEDEDGEYCVQGYRECNDGAWSECIFAEGAERYAIIGDPELCGGCDPACFRVHDCPTQRDLNADNSNNVRYDLDADGLILGGQLFNARFAYTANGGDSSVSKFDLATGIEVGRYLVGLPGFRCSANSGGCNQPSRTAIDSRGDAYVASRAFGGQASVTKIAGDRSSCYDRDRDGTIQTSAGGHDVRAYGDDECVLWTVEVGGTNDIARAVAVDRYDRVWVGMYNGRRFYVLDPSDGAEIRHVDTNIGAYGAAIDANGLLWFTTRQANARWIQSIDTETFALNPEIANDGCDETYYDRAGDPYQYSDQYGIAVDILGRVFLACSHQSTYQLARYDPYAAAGSRWLGMTVRDGYTRGVTVDAAGRVWVASHSDWWNTGTGWATSFDAETGGSRVTYTLTGCDGPIGIGPDFSGNIWTSCYGSSGAARLDPDTGTVDFFSGGPHPYTYSDFTGFLRATITSPEGSYTRRHDSRLACAADQATEWSQLYFEGETPTGSQINFHGRTAELTTDLGMAPEMLLASVPGDASPASISDIMRASGVDNGMRYFDVRVQLVALDGATTPIFRNMNMVYYCTCPCDASAACETGCTCDEDC